MNVFILCTGRCGSVTFIEACRHITNYSAEHESRARLIGAERLNYPPRHIEADNRLSWFLGRLDAKFGDNACYVHLKRDERKTAQSLLNRYDAGMMRAYAAGILMRKDTQHEPFDVCLDYCQTVNSNIAAFLKGKSNQLTVTLENAKDGFRQFWERIGAEGDLSAALHEWDVVHNASDASLLGRAARAVRSLARSA